MSPDIGSLAEDYVDRPQPLAAALAALMPPKVWDRVAKKIHCLDAVVLYFGGVQVPTVTINVPLNNRLQTLDLETMDDGALAQARSAFERRWNRWNRIRTVVATVTSALLMVLVLLL